MATPPEASLLFLIGPRGSGKTTCAQFLAEALGWNWLDADTVLEERYGQSIRSIFASEGEASFRDKEETVLEELCRGEKQVIATGGGVILRSSNRIRLQKHGWVVYLSATVATLSQRLQSDPTTAERRPALTAAQTSASSAQEIASILTVREPLYRECANLIVDTTARTPADIVAEILAVWRKAE